MCRAMSKWEPRHRSRNTVSTTPLSVFITSCRSFVLAATEHLHRKITKLSERVRLLEDALASLHNKHSNEPHPLLRDDLLSGNSDDKIDMAMPEDGVVTPQTPDVIDAFGTLSISDHGISRFFGPTGGSEVRYYLSCLVRTYMCSV